MRHVRWFNATSTALLLTVIACTGAVSSPPNSPPATDADTSVDLSLADAQAKKIYNTFYPALETATDWYIFANDSVKAAHESGIITSDQVRALRLREAKTVLETAKATAVAYLRALKAGQAVGNSDTSRFTTQILAAQSTVNALLQLAKELGVIQ